MTKGQPVLVVRALAVKHPNCIAFHDMYDGKEKLYIVMELVTGVPK